MQEINISIQEIIDQKLNFNIRTYVSMTRQYKQKFAGHKNY